jgi:hypothetical protein
MPTFRNTLFHLHRQVGTHAYLPVKMEQTECFETSAYKFQTPGNYPKESIQHLEHGESLKWSIFIAAHPANPTTTFHWEKYYLMLEFYWSPLGHQKQISRKRTVSEWERLQVVSYPPNPRTAKPPHTPHHRVLNTGTATPTDMDRLPSPISNLKMQWFDKSYLKFDGKNFTYIIYKYSMCVLD